LKAKTLNLSDLEHASDEQLQALVTDFHAFCSSFTLEVKQDDLNKVDEDFEGPNV